MKKTRIRFVSIILCIAVFISTLPLSASSVESYSGSSYTVTSSTTNEKLSILHMDRTVAESPGGGFDVTLTSYLDDLGTESVPLDVIFVADSSNSLSGKEREELSTAIQSTITSLKQSPTNHRIAMVSFSRSILENASLLTLTSVHNINLSNTNDSFVEILKSYENVDLYKDAGTHIWKGLDKADEIFTNQGSSARQKVCILLTDGAPTDDFWYWGYSEEAANFTLQSAAKLKKQAVVYTVEAYYQVMSNVSEETCHKINRYVTSAYGTDAVDINKDYHYDYDYSGFVSSVEDVTGLNQNLAQISVKSKIYPFILNSFGYTQDVVSPYFTPSNAKAVIETPVFSSTTSISYWNTSQNINAVIDGQRVYVTGFDYSTRSVSYPNRDLSARLKITYHIDPIENFFGGNDVPTCVPGTSDDNLFTSGGSGIYCNGYFLKQFEDIPVNIRTTGTPVSIVETTILDYGTAFDVNSIVTASDFTSGIIDGINNAFVTITLVAFIDYDSKEDYVYGEDVCFINIKPKESYQVSKLNFINGLIADSYVGDKIKLEYRVTPVTPFDQAKNYVTYPSITDANNGYIINQDIGVVKTDTLFNVDFEYVNLPAELSDTVALPDEKTNVTRDEISKYLTEISPQMGDGCGVDGYALTFSGWSLLGETKESDGTITLHYEGEWFPEGQFVVEVYVMDQNGNYHELPNERQSFEGEIGAEVYIASEYQSYDTRPNWYSSNDSTGWLTFYDDNSGTNIKLTKDNVPEKLKYNFVGDYVKYYDYQNQVGFDIKSLDDNKPLFTCYDFHFCSYCGAILEDVNWCYSCGCYPEPVYYKDFQLDSDKTVSYIQLGANLNNNIIKLYYERVKHDLTFELTNEETNTVKNFTVNEYYDEYLGEQVYDETNIETGYNSDYLSLVLSDYIWWIPVESTPFYDFEFTHVSSFYDYSFDTFVSYENFNKYISDYWEVEDYWVQSQFESLSPMAAYDRTIKATLTPRYFDMEIKKEWDESAEKQNCVFALYEIDDNEEYNLVTRFVIGVDETSKTIKNLRAGKKYVVEEESWAYKTESGYYRDSLTNEIIAAECLSSDSYKLEWYYDYYCQNYGSLYILEPDDAVKTFVCKNYSSSKETVMTVEKGVRNYFENGNNSNITSSSILKT